MKSYIKKTNERAMSNIERRIIIRKACKMHAEQGWNGYKEIENCGRCVIEIGWFDLSAKRFIRKI